MYSPSIKKYLRQNPIIIPLLALTIIMVACSSSITPTLTPTTSFEYQVHVTAKDTGNDLANAEVRIEVGTQAPLNEITDTNGTARIFINSAREGQPALLIVDASGYKRYDLNIDLNAGVLPATIQLEPGPVMPTPFPTLDGTFGSINLLVSEPIKTSACFTPGQKILVTAKGNMILGENVGSSNADGKDNFEVLGVSIPIDKKYYMYREYSLGALMCKLDSQTDWMVCGTSKSWDIDTDGCVEFQVNDSITTDNSGAYDVTIETLR